MGAFKPISDKFWGKVEMRSTAECWLWLGGKDKDGYGLLSLWDRIHKVKGSKGAHRVVWELTFGEIPKDSYICHHCDNPSCVNPKHLYIGNGTSNMFDMWGRKRHKVTKKCDITGRFVE